MNPRAFRLSTGVALCAVTIASVVALIAIAGCGDRNLGVKPNSVVDTSSIGAGGPPSANLVPASGDDVNATMTGANSPPGDDGSAMAPNEAIADDQSSAPDDAATEAFNTRFEESTRQACVKTGEARGGDPEKIESYCACVVSSLRSLPVQEKVELPQNHEALEIAARACGGD